MEIEIGDKVKSRLNSGAKTVGLVYRVKSANGIDEIAFISNNGTCYKSESKYLTVVAKAHYQPTIEVGDKVMVLENGKEGIVFKIDFGSSLPYSVGLVDRGTSWGYSSKELKLIAKASYKEQE